MKGIGEKVGEKTALGICYAGDIGDEPQGGAVADAAHYRVQANGLKFGEERLGADPVIAQEHHSFLALFMGDIHHLAGQLGHLPALKGLKVQKFPGGDPVLVVVVPLIDDVLGAEGVADLALEPLQDVRGNGGGVAVPVHIFFPPELIEDQCELVEEGGIADHIHIGVVVDEFPEPLHGICVGLGLADVKGDLVLEIRPAIGDGVVHVDGVPDEVGQKAHRILMERSRAVQYHLCRSRIITPVGGGHHRSGGAVHHLPPALDIVPGIGFHELRAHALHQGNGEGAFPGGVKAGHDIALLYLVGVLLCPCIILPGGVVGGVDLGVHPLESVGVIGAVAVPDGVGAPALQQLQCFRDHIHIRGDCDTAPAGLLTHGSLS